MVLLQDGFLGHQQGTFDWDSGSHEASQPLGVGQGDAQGLHLSQECLVMAASLPCSSLQRGPA